MAMLVGCGASDTGTEPEIEGRLFGVSFQTMNNPFFVDLNEGLKEVIEANGDRLVTLDAQWNSLKQKNDVSDLILQDAAAIFIKAFSRPSAKAFR
jgi:ribose transport system substrate-binding protein